MYVQQKVVPYMDTVISQIKVLKSSIPPEATQANGLKKIIEDQMEQFNEGFEFSKLLYF